MSTQEHDAGSSLVTSTEDSRRAFLAKCGKFAVVTSPAVTLLLDTSMASATVYASGKPPRHGRGSRRRRGRGRGRHGRPRVIIHKVIHYDGGRGPAWPYDP